MESFYEKYPFVSYLSFCVFMALYAAIHVMWINNSNNSNSNNSNSNKKIVNLAFGNNYVFKNWWNALLKYWYFLHKNKNVLPQWTVRTEEYIHYRKYKVRYWYDSGCRGV